MKKAYSYIRFSTPEQLKGDSLRRQLEASQIYAQQNNFELDTSMRDLGISAFKGKNRTEGALKKFIDLVDDGTIEKGSVLILESLDRLSRQEIMSALNLFTSILSSGIEIHTLSDNLHYTAESINNIGNLIISLVVMSRAHEESAMKSKRVAASWESRRKQTAEGKILTSIGPNWLKLNDKREWEIIEDRAIIIREIFAKTISGVGRYKIAKEFNSRGLKGWGRSRGWHESYIQKVLVNRAVMGEMQPYTGRPRQPAGDPIKGYYPKIIPDEIFYQAESERNKRKGKGGRRGKLFSNLFNGCGFCFNCGAPLRMLDKGGSNEKCRRYLACSSAIRKHNDCKNKKYINYDVLENIILIEAAENIDWFSVLANTETELSRLKNKKILLDGKIKEVKSKADNYALFLEQADSSILQVAMNKYNTVLKEQADIEADLISINQEISLHLMPSISETASKLSHALNELQNETDMVKKYEMRATVNGILKDNLKIYVGHVDGEQMIFYRLNSTNEFKSVCVGDSDIKLSSMVNTIKEKEHIISASKDILKAIDADRDAIKSEMDQLYAIIEKSGAGC